MINLKKLSTALFLTLSLASIALESTTPQIAVARTPAATTANRVYTKANPAVVMIRGNTSRGSGFIIPGGYIVTNAHVLRGQPAVMTFMMADGQTEIPADVVGFAQGGIDLALLKINRPENFPTLKLGNNRNLRVGDNVYAIGTPLLELNNNTFTTGTVSAFRAEGQIIQHNASINVGNSGGPLLNEKGEVVGVNTWVLKTSDGGTTNIGYAIGVNVVKQFLADARQGNLSPVATIK